MLVGSRENCCLFAFSPAVELWWCLSLQKEEGPQSLRKAQHKVLAGKTWRRAVSKRVQRGEKLVETGNLSLQKESPQPHFRDYMKEFSWCLLWVSLCLIYTKSDWIAPRLQRNGGLQHHCAKATFSNLLNTALPADLRLPHLRFPCSIITHKVCMEALWHVFASGEREEGGKSGAAAGWVTVPWAMEKGVTSKRTVQDAHGLVCAKKEKKKSTMQSFIQLLTCRLGKYFSHSSIFGMMHFGSNLSILVSIQRGLS